MEVSGQLQAPATLPAAKSHGTDSVGDIVGPIGCLGVFKKRGILSHAAMRNLCTHINKIILKFRVSMLKEHKKFGARSEISQISKYFYFLFPASHNRAPFWTTGCRQPV